MSADTEPSPKPPDPSLKALVLPPRPLLWAQETQRTGLTHPRMTLSPNNPGDIRDTHVDVSKDAWDLLRQQEAATNDGECTSAPNFIPDWVLPADELQKLIDEGQGAAPDLIYARGIPDSPHPPSAPSQRKECALLIIEIGFCRDLQRAKRGEDNQI